MEEDPNLPFWNIQDLDDGYLFVTRGIIVTVGILLCIMYVQSYFNIRWRVVQLPTRIFATVSTLIWTGFAAWTWITNYNSQAEWFRATYGLAFVSTIIGAGWCLHQAIYRVNRFKQCSFHTLVEEITAELDEEEDVGKAIAERIQGDKK